MRTLVLNAGYEPLAVVSFKRALLLVLNNKAVVLEGLSEQRIRSATAEFELPVVILLSRYVRIPNSKGVPLTRRGVLRRDGFRCAYCDKSADTVDHVHPRSRGGADSWENLVACCLRCNNAKGDKTLSEIGWELTFKPKAPVGLIWSIRGAEREQPEWSPYLAMQRQAA